MTSIAYHREIATLLADDPELLAIADAIAATQPSGRRRARRRRLALALAAALAVGFAVALFAFTRWWWGFGLRRYSGSSA